MYDPAAHAPVPVYAPNAVPLARICNSDAVPAGVGIVGAAVQVAAPFASSDFTAYAQVVPVYAPNAPAELIWTLPLAPPGEPPPPPPPETVTVATDAPTEQEMPAPTQ